MPGSDGDREPIHASVSYGTSLSGNDEQPAQSLGPPLVEYAASSPRDIIGMWFQGRVSSQSNVDTSANAPQAAPPFSASHVLSRELKSEAAVANADEVKEVVQQCMRVVQQNQQLVIEDRRELAERMKALEKSIVEQVESQARFVVQSRAQQTSEFQDLLANEFKSHRVWTADNFSRLRQNLSSANACNTSNGHVVREAHQKAASHLASSDRSAAKLASSNLGRPQPCDGDEGRFSAAAAVEEIGLEVDLDEASAGKPIAENRLASDAACSAHEALRTRESRSRKRSQHILLSNASDPSLESLGFESESSPAPSAGRGRTGRLNGEKIKIMKAVDRMAVTEKSGSMAYRLMQSLTTGPAFGARTSEKITKYKKKPKSRLIDWVDSHAFSIFCVVLILANACWIGYHTDQSTKRLLRHPSTADEGWWRIVTAVFSVCFAAELILRIVAYRSAFFLRHDKLWNYFDCFVVSCSLFEEIIDVLNLNFLRALRVVRLVRVVRIIRVLRFFSGLRNLMCAVFSSFWILVWAIFVMGFVMYMFAIGFMQGTHQTLETDSAADKLALEKHWGSLYTTMTSLLMAVSGGLPWEVLIDELALATWLFKPVFCVYIIFVTFGILNVIAGVFLEQTRELKTSDRDLAIHQEMHLTHCFVVELRALLEDNGLHDDDTMDWECFKKNMARIDVQMYLQTHHIDITEAEDLFKLLDQDETGSISIDAFVYGCQRIKGLAKGMDLLLVAEQVDTLKFELHKLNDRVVSEALSSERHQKQIFNNVMALREDFLDTFWSEPATKGDGMDSF